LRKAAAVLYWSAKTTSKGTVAMSEGPTPPRSPRSQPNAIPIGALKRFADDLRNSGPSSNANRFLQVNLKRVSDFIDKTHKSRLLLDDDGDGEAAVATANKAAGGTGVTDGNGKSTRLQRPGVYDYPEVKEYKSILSLQKNAEFNTALGIKSRFGDGDGSFLDRWLTSPHEPPKSNSLVKGEIIPPFSGFKRHVTAFKQGGSAPEIIGKVKPYAQRRAERLQREQLEKDIANGTVKPAEKEAEPAGLYLRDAPWQDIPAAVSSSPSVGNNKSPIGETSFLTLPPLTENEKEQYFGNKARAAFFDFYKQLSRQQNIVSTGPSTSSLNRGGKGGGSKVGGSLSSLLPLSSRDLSTAEEEQRGTVKSSLFAEEEHIKDKDDEEEGEDEDEDEGEDEEEKEEEEESIPGLLLQPITHLSDVAEEAVYEAVVGEEEGGNDEEGRERRRDERRQAEELARIKREEEAANVGKGNKKKKHKKKRDVLSFAQKAMMRDERDVAIHLKEPTGKPGSFGRPLSARTRFIVDCLDNDFGPRPGLLIRKDVSSTLNLSSQAIGDDLAILLANALAALPFLSILNVRDNSLTDPGLTAIITSLAKCPSLISVDISKNKVDLEAATALSQYLSSSGCRLVNLIMQESDIDDIEAGKFMAAVGVQNTIKYVDMSKNLLGSMEISSAATAPDTMMGAEAIAKLLERHGCSVETMILSWNMIRVSGIPLARSLKINQSLTHLDLSYNGLGNQGGEVLGESLQHNKRLISLNLAQNKLQARAVFTILSGVRTCHSMRSLDLSDNPIGEMGARAVVALNITMGAGEINVDIKGCSLRVRDPLCWFDPKKPVNAYTLDLAVPYERAICIELLRIAADSEDYEFTSFSYTAAGASVKAKEELQFGKRKLPRVSRKPVIEEEVLPNSTLSNGDNKEQKVEQAAGKEVKKEEDLLATAAVKENSEQNVEEHVREQYEEAIGDADVPACGVESTSMEAVEESTEAAEAGAEAPMTVEPIIDAQEPSSALLSRNASRKNSDIEATVSINSVAKKIPTLFELSHHVEAAVQAFHQVHAQSPNFSSTAPATLSFEQLEQVFLSLGLEDESTLIASEVMTTYDQDGSGFVLETEFVDFFTRIQNSPASSGGHSSHYLVLLENKNKPKVIPYIPPETGVVTCTLVVNQSKSDEEFETVTAEDVQGVLQGLKGVSDSVAMLEAAVGAMKLKLEEAAIFFRFIMRETGDKVYALRLLLPRMVTPSEAKKLMIKFPFGSVQESLKLKHALGHLYRLIVGLPNGYYSLNIEDPNDAECLARLININNSAMSKRIKAGLGDTSQKGNGFGFRNSLHDGTPCLLDKEWIENLPLHGRVEFDFVLQAPVPMDETGVVSDKRFYKMLYGLDIFNSIVPPPPPSTPTPTPNSSRNNAASPVATAATSPRLEKCDEESVLLLASSQMAQAREAARGVGAGACWERDHITAIKEGSALALLFDGLSKRYSEKNESNMHVEMSSGELAMHDEGRSRMLEEEGVPLEVATTTFFEVSCLHIKALKLAGCVWRDERLLGIRNMNAIVDACMHKFITCTQLSLLVQYMQGGKQPFHLRVVSSTHANSKNAVMPKDVSVVENGEEEKVALESGALNMLKSVADAVAFESQRNKGKSEAEVKGEEEDDEEEEKEKEEEKEEEEEAEERQVEEEVVEIVTQLSDEQIVLQEMTEAFEFAKTNSAPCEYGTVRVELIITLFSLLVDVVNFDLVLKCLSLKERAAVIFRLGWLNTWSPLKLNSGFFSLDLARREEKQVARMLMLLTKEEASCVFKFSFLQTPNRQADPSDPTIWPSIPATFFSESSLPSVGILTTCFHCGGALSPRPPPNFNTDGSIGPPGPKDVSMRFLLTTTVLGKPYFEDAKTHLFLSTLETLIEEKGLKLFFSVEKQEEAAAAKKETAAPKAKAVRK